MRFVLVVVARNLNVVAGQDKTLYWLPDPGKIKEMVQEWLLNLYLFMARCVNK